MENDDYCDDCPNPAGCYAVERCQMPDAGKTTSRSFLEMRWHDKQLDKWTKWEEVGGYKLRQYGDTPEEWKIACKRWIESGGCYEYRIGTRTEVVDWEISYCKNATAKARRSAADCSAWLNPETDPPTMTGRILVWIAGIGPHLVNVSEMSCHFWDGQDDTKMTSPDEWEWWTEITPPNA